MSYDVILSNNKNHPYLLSKRMMDLGDKLKSAVEKHLDRAILLFVWSIDHIKYKEKGGTYRTAKEVFEQREGICGESANFFIAMSRYMGLNADYASVRRDHTGESVAHACSVIHFNRPVLVDVAYKMFDVKHKNFTILSEERSLERIVTNGRRKSA